MRGSLNDLPVVAEIPGYKGQGAEWGDTTVMMESSTVDMDPAQIFKGLPDDRCQAHHYGYVIKGQITYRYKDHEEVFNEGDAYYVPPGHLPLLAAGTVTLEFTPTDELRQTLEVVMHNLEAAQQT